MYQSIFKRLNPITQSAADGFSGIDLYLREIISDVHDLLNARTYMKSADSGPLAGSILSYGMSDLSSFNPEANADQDKLRSNIKQIISLYEPRLSNIRVDRLNSAGDTSLEFAFNIYAGCIIAGEMLQIEFNSLFQPADALLKIRDYRYER